MTEVIFPDLPLYKGWGKPLRVESRVEGLSLIAGHVPKELDGTLYRGGPDRQYPPMLGEDIFVDGEGMAHMFRFRDGNVSYRSAWVRNDRFNLQAEHGRSLFGRYRNRYTDAPEAAGVSGGTANTNLIFHAGRLLVLKEDDLPWEMDPDTLETRGRFDYDGRVSATSMTAHPKIHPDTGQLLTYSYQAKGDGSSALVYYEMTGDGTIVDEIWFDMPWASIVHDFAVTEHYAIFGFIPLVTDIERVKAGHTFYEWHKDKHVEVALVKRHGTAADIRWFRGPPGSLSHMLNAYEEGSLVHMDACYYDGNCFSFFPTPEGETTPGVPPILSRLTFDLSRNDSGFERRPLLPFPAEMPRNDDRYQGLRARNGFAIARRSTDGTSELVHIDVTTGALKFWSAGPRSSVHEPQFVARHRDAPEGDGWLLVIVNRLDEGHSDLAILDATDIEAGPVALLEMPVRVRSTFHGTWVAGDVLRRGAY